MRSRWAAVSSAALTRGQGSTAPTQGTSTLPPCSAGIHMKALQFFVEYHFQDMRMPTDKQLAFLLDNLFFHPGGIPSRVTTDMADENINFFTGKEKVFRKFISYRCIINIAINTL
jgi:hypothetical protein